MGQKITGSDQSHKFGNEKPHPVIQNRPVGKPISPDAALRYLYQPGDQEGGQRRATDPIWSVSIHKISHYIVLQGIKVYYLMPPALQIGFVTEELLIVPADTQTRIL